jgi:hypothetical protein
MALGHSYETTHDQKLPLLTFPSSQPVYCLTSPIHPFRRASSHLSEGLEPSISQGPNTISSFHCSPSYPPSVLQLEENGAKSLHVMIEHAHSLAIPLVSLQTKLKWERSPLQPTQTPSHMQPQSHDLCEMHAVARVSAPEIQPAMISSGVVSPP